MLMVNPMPDASMRSIRRSVAFVFVALVIAPMAGGAGSALAQANKTLRPSVVLTAEQDHQRTMELLHITALRPGADGRNAQAPNAANYDEAKANPYPTLPDPLMLKNGRKVTTA